MAPLAVSSKENLAETPGPSSLYTSGKMAEVTACELKEKISDINCETRAGLLQLNRFLVDKIVEVKNYISSIKICCLFFIKPNLNFSAYRKRKTSGWIAH